jgi:hypothetical protein
MGDIVEKTLSSGKTVYLAQWQGSEPTTHTEDTYAKKFNPNDGRSGLKFYDSTIQFMRNDWAEKHMSPTPVSIGNKNAMLFYHQKTGTWHSAEALDIDHITVWKDHLKEVKAGNMAEAQMGYNDIANLRLLPSVYNRSRDSAERMFDQRDNNPKQWNDWIKNSFQFDNSVSHPSFDPEKDFARRKKSTIDAPWTEENTRSDLRFDKKVNEKWFTEQLQTAYAGSVQVQNPDTKQMQEVPLFRCAATGQLVTRDALDIDHKIPFEILQEKMLEVAKRGNHVLTKANVLDAYNDTSNLRLVSRSANSSHEWEIGKDGEFRDKMPKGYLPEQPREFDGFIVPDKGLDPKISQTIRQHFDPTPMPQPVHRDQSGPITILTPRHHLNQEQHPAYPVFAHLMKELQRLDPEFKAMGSLEGHQRMATSLMVAAKERQMPGIETLMPNKEGNGVLAVYGKDPSTAQAVGVTFEQALQRTVSQNSAAFDKLPTNTLPQQNDSLTQTNHKINL